MHHASVWLPICMRIVEELTVLKQRTTVILVSRIKYVVIGKAETCNDSNNCPYWKVDDIWIERRVFIICHDLYVVSGDRDGDEFVCLQWIWVLRQSD